MKRFWPLTLRGTGALVLSVAFFIGARELGVAELVYFGVLLLAVVAACLCALYLVRRSETVVRLLQPEVASVGRPAQVTVRVGMRAALPTSPGLWRDALPRFVRGEASGMFPALGAGLGWRDRRVDLQYAITPTRRGLHRIGPLTVVATDPFGIARRARTLGERTTITVAPAVVELLPAPTALGDSGGRTESTTDQLGQGSDNLVARPWASGDSMRRIHWRATAHRGELMVRQEERESTPEAVVVLDRSAPRWAESALHAPGADAGFEQAVSACVSVVARLVADGYSVILIDADGSPLAEPLEAGDLVGVDGLVAAFASVTTRRDDHLPLLGRWFAGGTTGPVVVIAGSVDTSDIRPLSPVVHHSAVPVLLTVSPVGDAVEAFAETGWHAAAIPPGADLAAAWASVAAPEPARV